MQHQGTLIKPHSISLAVLPEVVGFDIDLSDLFSLGISTADMDLTINNIDVEDNSNATVAATMHLNGVKQKINFIMVYEVDGWFIHDIIER